jgi:hypothetical protein
MVIALVFSVVVAVLEYLGWIRDPGLVLSLVGIALAVGFGVTGSSQRTVEAIRFDLRGVRRDLARLGSDLSGLRHATTRGFAETTRSLVEIAALLRERLPPR